MGSQGLGDQGGIDPSREEDRQGSRVGEEATDGALESPLDPIDPAVEILFRGRHAPANAKRLNGARAPPSVGDRHVSRALIVDRDGTIIPDLHYLADPERLELLRGVGESLRVARAHGYRVVCVTNQSGIGRGFYTANDVDRVHRRLNERLEAEGTRIDAFYYCPHLPEEGCACRKPATELFDRAQRDLDLDWGRSAIIGDRWLDMEAGRRLGLLTAFVPAVGHERESDLELTERNFVPDIRAATFRGATYRVLARG